MLSLVNPVPRRRNKINVKYHLLHNMGSQGNWCFSYSLFSQSVQVVNWFLDTKVKKSKSIYFLHPCTIITCYVDHNDNSQIGNKNFGLRGNREEGVETKSRIEGSLFSPGSRKNSYSVKKHWLIYSISPLTALRPFPPPVQLASRNQPRYFPNKKPKMILSIL